MGLMASIEKGRQYYPPRIELYGTEGIGKSTFAANAPAPIFIQTEDGLGQIDCHRFPVAKSLAEVIAAISGLASEKHDYKTAVIDSLDWLERMVWDEVCREFGVKSIEKADGGYGKGYVHALVHWRKILDGLDYLRVERGMVTILIAHCKIEKFEDPDSASYDRYSPRLNKHAAALISEWSDAVLFATRKFRTENEEGRMGQERSRAVAIGKDGGERILRTVGGPSCVAKNRYNLPSEVALSWGAFMDAIAKGTNNG